MDMFWSGRWTMTGGRGGGAFAHILRAATIAMVTSSCSTMNAQSEQGVADVNVSQASSEEYDAPRLIVVDTEESEQILSEEIKRRIQGEFPDTQILSVYAVTVYKDPSTGSEKLLAIGPISTEPLDLDAYQFLIPPVEGDLESPGGFNEAVVIFTGSPAGARSCGAASSAGTRYVRRCNRGQG
jgi:hypothetical protein